MSGVASPGCDYTTLLTINGRKRLVNEYDLREDTGKVSNRVNYVVEIFPALIIVEVKCLTKPEIHKYVSRL